MKKYLFIIYAYLKKRTTYKWDIILGYLFSIIIALTAKYFWVNLSASGKIPQGELLDYISYSALTTVTGILLGGEVISTFSEKIKNGSVTSDLQKPLSFQLYTMAGGFGTIMGQILFDMLPKFIAMNLLLGIYIPGNPLNGLLFCISFFLGCLIIVMIDYILSIFSVYFVEIISLIILKSVAMGLFAGAAIPLWIFPERFLNIINLLPFRLIFYFPISVYLEKISFADTMNCLLLQVFWLVVLSVIGKAVSHVVLKRITVAGG